MVSWKHSVAGVSVALAIAGSLAACGDDDNGAGPGGADASADVAPPPPGDGGPDGGRCEFNAFVVGLINGSTNATAQPSENLGDDCTDNQTPFPDTLFQ